MADDDENDVGTHKLNLAGTKPVMFIFIGIPFLDFVYYLIGGMQMYMFRWQLLIPLIFFVIFMIALYRRDHYAGRRLMCWLRTSARCLATHYEGGTFVQVEPARNVYRGTLPCLFR